MKRLVLIIIMLALSFTQTVPAFAIDEEPETVSVAAVLMDAKTGEVIYEKNPERVMEPASITKVMTCMLAIENLDLDKKVTITRDMDLLGHVMSLKEGEQLTVRQLLYSMMVWSANDAAVVLAEEVSGSVTEFAELSTKRAHELGAESTFYKNPNGLNDVTGHVTTAEDLALICRWAMKNKTFRKIVSTVRYEVPAKGASEERKFKSTNRLLYDKKSEINVNGRERFPKYEGAIGIKTGQTGTAGYCLAGSAKRKGTEFIAVILFAPDDLSRFSDCIKLLDFGFDNYHTYRAYKPGETAGKVKIKNGSKLKVDAEVKDGAYATLSNEGSDSLVSQKIIMRQDLKAPVKKGTKAGTVNLYVDDIKVGEAELVVSESVKKGGPWTAVGVSDMAALIILILLVIIFIALLVILICRSKRKKAERARRTKKEKARIREEEEARIRRAKEAENKRRRDWPY
jgi:D-alanyl-D-alanine carboxypeptidase (penicillin-binding protein 5/6)